MAHPPWHLSGELLVAVVGRPRGSSSSVGECLPAGVRPAAGPALLIALSYANSPVGPFCELTLAMPARLGLRPGLCSVASVVTTSDARVDYRLNWGVPAECGTLQWDVDGPARRLAWLERGIVVEGVAGRLLVPAVLPARSVQRRADGCVVVPRWLGGWLRPGRVTVKVPSGSQLSWADGAHPGGTMTGMRMTVAPARHPRGKLSTLRAPLQAPSTGLTASSR